MAKTIGQLRAEGKSFKEIAKIGEKQLSKTAKGRKALRRLKRSVGGRRGKPGKTQAQVQAEERQRALLEAKKKADTKARLKEEKRLRELEAKRITALKAKLEKEKKERKLKASIATKKQLREAIESRTVRQKVITGTIQPTPSPKTKRKVPFIKTIAEVRFAGKGEQLTGKPASGFVKRASADIVSVGKSLVGTARDLSTVATALPNTPKRIAAQQRLSSAFSLTSLVAIGPSIGRDVTSTNPYERTRGMASFLSTFVGTPIKGIKPKVQSSASSYDVKTNMVSGSTKVNVKTKGTLTNGDKFTQNAKLRFDPKTGSIVGTSTTSSRSKKITEILNFKDKGGFYQDKKTGKKIDKTKLPLDDIKVSIKETRTKQTKPDVTRTYEGNIIKTGQRDVKVTKTDITIKNGKKTTVARSRKSKLDFVSDVKEAGTKLKEAVSIPKLLDVKVTRGKTAKAKALDERKVQGFLKAIRYDVEIIHGLDKRTRLARALGLRKTNATLKRFETLLNKNTIITRKGTLKGKGFTETIRPISFRLGPAFPKLKIKPKKLSKTKKKDLFKIPRDITIPKLKVKIKNIKKFRLRGLLPIKESSKALRRMEKRIKAIEQKKEPIKKPVQKVVPVQKKKVKKPLKKKPISKVISKAKPRPIKKPRVPKIKIPVKVIKPKIPSIRFKVKNLPKGGIRIGYIIKVKRSNRIIAQSSTLLPRKRAINLARHITDGKKGRYPLGASYDVVAKGKTNIKDVKNLVLGHKFRAKKSKSPKVLRSVEQRKFRADTKAETSALARERALKKKKKTTKKVKKKTLKRKPNSKKKRKVNKSRKK